MHSDSAGLPPGGEWVSVFRSSSRRPCEEQALVLKAMGLDHVVTEQPDGCSLLVPATQAARARQELALYHRENPGHRPPPWPYIEPRRGLVVAVAFAALISIAFVVQFRYAWGIDWLSSGELVAGQVRAGQWWRVVTALCLHSDVAHVGGNMVFGAFFAYLAGQYLGSGIAAVAIVWSAAAGNLANAWLQTAGHRSIGASTAVFAALGLVAAFVWGISRRFTLGWARRWAPVVGAVALLAFTGTGDENTDVVAHLMGFLAGAAGGGLLYRAGVPLARTGAAQAVAAGLALATLAAAWMAALSAA